MNRIISTHRGDFNIKEYGEVSNPPLILLHGWPQTSYSWHHLAAHLSDFYIIAPDLRGMGDSNRELNLDYYTKDEMAKDIYAIADALSLDQFYLAGHDWGGAIAQEMAFLLPDRILKMIILNMVILNNPIGKKKVFDLLSGTLFRSSWYQHFLSIREFPEVMIQGKEEAWVRFFSRGISNPIPEDAIQEYIRCYKLPKTITTAANLYRTISKDRKRWKEFEGTSIDITTQIIYGIEDPVIIKEYLEGVDNYFREVQVSQLTGGHFIVDEQPELVGKSMDEFLKS